MSGCGTVDVPCAGCGRTFELTRQPDYGVDYVCQRCKQRDAVDRDLAEHGVEYFMSMCPGPAPPATAHNPMQTTCPECAGLYDAAIEDQEQP